MEIYHYIDTDSELIFPHFKLHTKPVVETKYGRITGTIKHGFFFWFRALKWNFVIHHDHKIEYVGVGAAKAFLKQQRDSKCL